MRGEYTLKACEDLISKYVNEYGGEAVVFDEGVLGLGTIVLRYATGMKSYVIKEFYINAWSSGHTIRAYNKLPKKYEKWTEDI